MTPEPTVRRMMSISHAEFLRSLEPLGRYYAYRIEPSGREVLVQDPMGQIEISLGEEQRHRLGSLQLPQTMVTFRFGLLDTGSVERFLSRFDLCFRRGGG